MMEDTFFISEWLSVTHCYCFIAQSYFCPFQYSDQCTAAFSQWGGGGGIFTDSHESAS